MFCIPYGEEIRILDITFQETVAGSTRNMWFTVIKNREGLTHTNYNYLQKLCLIQRDQFVCRYLLSKLWYCTQVLPITSETVRHINTMIAWFKWKGNICRIPLSTYTHLPRQERRLGLLDIIAKFHTLLIKHCIRLLKKRVSLHDRMACTILCNVTNRQPARRKCFA
jgi:hypothetical protein